MPTPLMKDGRIDREGIRILTDFLIDGGIDGLFPLGTSGEFALLTHEERRIVTDEVVDRANGRVPVFVGVSDPSTENIKIFAPSGFGNSHSLVHSAKLKLLQELD